MKFKEIPEDIINEISFMLGSIEECQSEYLKPILEAHGYKDFDFLTIEPEDDKELSIDIYEKLFATGMLEPFGF